MRVTVTFDTEEFTSGVSQDGDLQSSRQARQLMALVNQTMPAFLESLKDVHGQLVNQEEQVNAARDASLSMTLPVEVEPEPEVATPSNVMVLPSKTPSKSKR